jgi:hypothetical protein
MHVVPVFLGGGARLLDNVGTATKLAIVRVVESPAVTHLVYRPR